MKIYYSKSKLTKVCHARPGDCVRVYDDEGNVRGLYMVCSVGKLEKKLGLAGLCDAGDTTIVMVNLQTGVLEDLPHLSKLAFERMPNAFIGFEE